MQAHAAALADHEVVEQFDAEQIVSLGVLAGDGHVVSKAASASSRFDMSITARLAYGVAGFE